jgi:tRNA pseudouridine65 synthase
MELPQPTSTYLQGSTVHHPSLPIVYQDDALVVVHKPGGIHTHTSAFSRREDSLLRWLRDQIGRHLYPIHRLDRASSGLVLFALEPNAAAALAKSLRDGLFKKRYLAVVRGFAPYEMRVDRPLRELLEDGTRGQEQDAVTDIRCLQQIEIPLSDGQHPTTRLSLVEARPQTGRRHQIRRHLRGLNHPLVGDTKHGDRHLNRRMREEMDYFGLALLAQSLSFPHPTRDALIDLSTGFDPDWQILLNGIGLDFSQQDLALPEEPLPLLPAFRSTPKRNWRHKANRQGKKSQSEKDRSERAKIGSDEIHGPTHKLSSAFLCPEGSPKESTCTLCNSSSPFLLHHLGRCFYSCPTCGLLHQEPRTRLTYDLEKERYLEHDNTMTNLDYRAYLQGVVDFVLPNLKADKNFRGLDMGCGPAPLLSQLFEEAGFPHQFYDPIFFPDTPLEPGCYDLITMIEAIEHSYNPLRDLKNLSALLRPNGWVMLQTALLTEEREGHLEDWHYLRDPTHVAIFRPRTMVWLADAMNWKLEKIEGDRLLFRRNLAST